MMLPTCGNLLPPLLVGWPETSVSNPFPDSLNINKTKLKKGLLNDFLFKKVLDKTNISLNYFVLLPDI